MHCLGCGVVPNARDRKVLTISDCEDVVRLWRMYVENEELGEDVDIERILTADDSQRLPKMCIKCFRAYRTCSKYHPDIQKSSKMLWKLWIWSPIVGHWLIHRHNKLPLPKDQGLFHFSMTVNKHNHKMKANSLTLRM